MTLQNLRRLEFKTLLDGLFYAWCEDAESVDIAQSELWVIGMLIFLVKKGIVGEDGIEARYNQLSVQQKGLSSGCFDGDHDSPLLD